MCLHRDFVDIFFIVNKYFGLKELLNKHSYI